MFGVAYLILKLTGVVVNTTQDYVYNVQNWCDAQRKGDVIYVDRKGAVRFTPTGELAFPEHHISENRVKELGLPIYCVDDNILLSLGSKKVLYNFSEVDREMRFNKKKHFKKPDETALLWSSIDTYYGQRGIIYKDCTNDKLYLERSINKIDLRFFMDFDTGYLVRLSDESKRKYDENDLEIKHIMDRFNKLQDKKLEYFENNKAFMSDYQVHSYIDFYFANQSGLSHKNFSPYNLSYYEKNGVAI